MKNGYRQIPTPLEYLVEATLPPFRLTLKQRIKLLLGMRVLVQCTLRCQHSPGKFLPDIALFLTPHAGAEAALTNPDSMDFVRSGEPVPTEDLKNPPSEAPTAD